MRALDALPTGLINPMSHAGKNIRDRRIHPPRAIAQAEQRLNRGGSMVFVEQIALIVIDHDPIGDALKNGIELFGLRLRVMVEACVFERDGRLRSQRFEQCLVIVAETPRFLVPL